MKVQWKLISGGVEIIKVTWGQSDKNIHICNSRTTNSAVNLVIRLEPSYAVDIDCL